MKKMYILIIRQFLHCTFQADNPGTFAALNSHVKVYKYKKMWYECQ